MKYIIIVDGKVYKIAEKALARDGQYTVVAACKNEVVCRKLCDKLNEK